MKLNKFKIAHEDDIEYHVLTPDGKTLTVSKDALSKHAHAVISKMERMSKDSTKDDSLPKFAQGAEVTDGSAKPDFQAIMGSVGEPTEMTPEIAQNMVQNVGLPAGTVEKGAIQAVAPVIEEAAMPVMQEAAGATKSVISGFGNVIDELRKEALAGLSHLNPAQKEALTAVDNQAIQAIQEHLHPEMVEQLKKLPEDQVKAILRAQPQMRLLRSTAQKYRNLATSGPLGSTATDALKNIPRKFAEGGDVQYFAEGEMVEGDSDSQSSASDDYSTPEVSQPAAQTSPSLTPSAAIFSMPGVADITKSATNMQANAISGQGAAEVKAFDELQKNISKLPTQDQIRQRAAQSEYDHYKAYEDSKIDPNRVWNNMGTGNKILASIGMLLSGAGTGSGQSNMAAKVVDDAINRDIDAQKQDQSKKFNLWKMNRENTESDLAANLATKNQMYVDVKYQLAKAASQFKGPQAKAAAMQANAMIDQELQKNNMIRSLLAPTEESTGGAPPDSEQAFLSHLNNIKAASSMDPRLSQAAKEIESRYIPNQGTFQHPVPTKVIERMDNMSDVSKLLAKAIDFRENVSGRGGAWTPEHKAQGEALMKNITDSYRPFLEDVKRTNPSEAGKLEDAIGDLNQMDLRGGNLAGLKQLKDFADQRLTTQRSSLGFKPFSEPSNSVVLGADGRKYTKVTDASGKVFYKPQ